jgi:hypothetical protein
MIGFCVWHKSFVQNVFANPWRQIRKFANARRRR